VIGESDDARYPQVRGTRPKPLNKNTDLVYAIFLASFLAEYGQDADDQVFTSNSYDAGWLLAYGASWAMLNEGGVVNGINIARGLRRLSRGTALDVGSTSWNMVQQRFADGDSIDVTGSSGPLDFDPDTEETIADIEVWTISGTTIVGAYTFPP
jgi:branched-chain amino acid transport system substrate-binding protein